MTTATPLGSVLIGVCGSSAAVSTDGLVREALRYADAVTVVVVGAVNVAPLTGDVTLTVGNTSPPASRAARYALSRPPDAMIPDHSASGSTLFMSSVLMPAGVRLGFRPLTSAATPATCGVAMLVPWYPV